MYAIVVTLYEPTRWFYGCIYKRRQEEQKKELSSMILSFLFNLYIPSFSLHTCTCLYTFSIYIYIFYYVHFLSHFWFIKEQGPCRFLTKKGTKPKTGIHFLSNVYSISCCQRFSGLFRVSSYQTLILFHAVNALVAFLGYVFDIYLKKCWFYKNDILA